MARSDSHPSATAVSSDRTGHSQGGRLFDDLKPALTAEEAVVEASRCLECGGPCVPAPCIVACPTGIDIPKFITAIVRGDEPESATTIFAENILGGSCARVCPVEVLCEGACVLEHEGRRPVEIGRLQRYATEWALARGMRFRMAGEPNGKRVAVIGAGPAGLACSGELAMLGYQITVYDAREDFGGLIRYAIAPYRQVREPLPQEVQMIADLGVEFHMGHPVDRPERLLEIDRAADAVFLGIGMGEDMNVTYPHDDLPGVWLSLEFIGAIKTGRPPKIGSQVVVIGGGNTAIDVAREAVRLGAGKVTVIYRRTEAEMPAYPHEVEEAHEEGVLFQWLTGPVRFVGEDRLEEIVCQHMSLGEPDSSGRPRPVPVPGTEFSIPAETAIKAIGQQPRVGFLEWIEGLELDHGQIRVDPETGQTTHPKYFAGGDAINGGGTVVEAIRDGKIAARGINRYLRGGGS